MKILLYEIKNDEIPSKPFKLITSDIICHKGDIIRVYGELYLVRSVMNDYDTNTIKVFVSKSSDVLY